MAKWRRRDVRIVLDRGYFTEDKPRASDGSPRIFEFTLKVKPGDQIGAKLSEALWRAGSDESGQLAAVLVLPGNAALSEYLSDQHIAQSVDFSYGIYGELYMHPLPFSSPTGMTFGQLEDTVNRHFPEFGTATVIVRAQGGFGGGGGSSILDQVIEWLMSESASHVFGVGLTYLIVRFRKLFSSFPKRRRSRRYAQIARDLVSRHVTGNRDIGRWLEASDVWRTGEVALALAVPRRLAAALLRRAGYARIGWTSQWALGRKDSERSARKQWVHDANEGYNWSPLDE